MLLIDEAACRQLLDMEEAVSWLAESFRAISTGPTVGMRGDVDEPTRSARGIVIASYVGALDGVCFKVVGNWNGNRAGLIVAFDTATGHADAAVSASYLTDFRTGAASAAATRQLARPESRSLALLGTGRQAVSQLRAMLAVLPIETVGVWSRTAANAERWVGEARDALGSAVPTLRVCGSAEEAVREADVVVTCTRATEPVLYGEWLRPGTHVNAIGAGTPHQRELDTSVLVRSEVKTVDTRELALRTGDFARPLRDGAIREGDVAELGEVLLGTRLGRTAQEQVTLFKSLGHAANDLAVVRHLAAKARRLGLGVEVEL